MRGQKKEIQSKAKQSKAKQNTVRTIDQSLALTFRIPCGFPISIRKRFKNQKGKRTRCKRQTIPFFFVFMKRQKGMPALSLSLSLSLSRSLRFCHMWFLPAADFFAAAFAIMVLYI